MLARLLTAKHMGPSKLVLLCAGSSETFTTSAPGSLQEVGLPVVKGLLGQLQAALQTLTSDRAKQLLLINDSQQYVRRLMQHLEQKGVHEVQCQR